MTKSTAIITTLIIYFLITTSKSQLNSKFLRKCCGLGTISIQDNCTVSKRRFSAALDVHNVEEYVRTVSSDEFTVLPMHENCTEMVDEEVTKLQENGSLYDTFQYYDYDEFCVEINFESEDSDNGTVVYQICYETEDEPSMIMIYGMIVSIPFLLITLLVYIILPDRNIPAKIIMCFVSTLILAYTFLISLQIGSIDTEDGCDIIAIICHYFFVSSFLWMNVSCIDIYWTFSGLRGFGGSKRAELKRFLLYCAYASGLPLIISGSVFALNYHPDNKAWFHPKIGHGRCWFEEKTPVLLYFYGPLGLIIFANIILFVLTSLKIRKVRKDTVMLKRADSRRHNADEKERFNLYVKLLFAMGVNWSFEIISWAVITYSRVNTAYWIITDFCNAIYGVSIFLIFVFKTKTYTQLKKRYNQIRRRSDPTGTMQDETENTLTSSVSHQKQSMLKINP